VFIYLAGLWDDGTPLAQSLAGNVRRVLQFPLGADVTVVLDVVANSGNPLTVTSATVKLTARVQPSSAPIFTPLVGVAPLPPRRGRVLFTIPNMIAKLGVSPGRYVYDIWATIGGVRNAVVSLSPMEILAPVGLPP
jgi:hypothetical protein